MLGRTIYNSCFWSLVSAQELSYRKVHAKHLLNKGDNVPAYKIKSMEESLARLGRWMRACVCQAREGVWELAALDQPEEQAED